MLFNELKEYKKLEEKYDHYRGILRKCEFELARYKQFCTFAKRDVIISRSKLNDLRRNIPDEEGKQSILQAEEDLNYKICIFDELLTRYHYYKNIIFEVLDTCDNHYEKMNNLFEKITNKKSYKLLSKINKKAKIEPTEKLERQEFKLKYSEKAYKQFVNFGMHDFGEMHDIIRKEFGENLVYSKRDFEDDYDIDLMGLRE